MMGSIARRVGYFFKVRWGPLRAEGLHKYLSFPVINYATQVRGHVYAVILKVKFSFVLN